MGDASEKIAASGPSISSPEHGELLNVIDKIRSHGVSRYIELPQLVVCGDQSSGKSSCLEAVCGRSFPTGEGLCTRFATEYILRRSPEENVTISILPEANRSEAERKQLLNFKPKITDLDQFSKITEEASTAMGIGNGKKTFAHDVLRIELSGPDQPHLTLVDLPGLFHSESKSHSVDDKKAVYDLVRTYISNSRSIILAVVSARNDLNNQAVLDFAREHDPNGDRTLGIITKPDTLSEGSPSENTFFQLASNADIKLALDWHVLRNRKYEERDSSTEERDELEIKFFNKGIWKSFDRNKKGIKTLRTRLGTILYQHILTELPNLLGDVDRGITDCQQRLTSLGQSRGTVADQRLYLLRASQKFQTLMTNSLQGTYSDPFFGSTQAENGFEKRLRAKSEWIIKKFAKNIRLYGHTHQLVDSLDPLHLDEPGTPILITKNNFYKKVEYQMERNTGLELPGFPNSAIIGDLFLEQSAPWRRLVNETRDELVLAAHQTIDLMLDSQADQATTVKIRRNIVNPNMQPLEAALSAKADEVLEPHISGHPTTANHYFTDTLQKMRAEQARDSIADRLQKFFGADPRTTTYHKPTNNYYIDLKSLLESLVKAQVEVDMGRYGAIEATNGMLAYYKVGSLYINSTPY
jgi:GTPase SAR1 family protein